MTNSEVYYFLGKCLILGENDEKDKEVIQSITQNKVDWDHLVTLSGGHLVQQTLYIRFKQIGILPLLPEELSDHLRMVYELNQQRNIAILGQINQINSLLATAGIVPIYLKGAGNLLDGLYEDVGERMIGDIDLLVSDAEFIQAVNLLKGEGYEHAYPFFECDRAITKHFPRLVHTTKLADVEIHRLPVEIDLAAHFNYEVIHHEVKLIETDPPCYVLSDRHKLVLNFMHGFMANDVRQMRTVSFRNMYDLFLLSHRVGVYQVFTEMVQYSQKSLVYADFVHHVMDLPSSHISGFHSRFLICRHKLFLSSKLVFRITWLLTYLLSRIWVSYLRNFAGIFFSKQIRRFVFRTLSDPTFYKHHIKSYFISINQNLRN